MQPSPTGHATRAPTALERQRCDSSSASLSRPDGAKETGMTPAKGAMRLRLPRPSSGAAAAAAAGCPGPHHCHTALPLQDVGLPVRVLLQSHVRSDSSGPSTCCNGGRVPESINTRTRRVSLSCGGCHRVCRTHMACLSGVSASLWSAGYQASLHIIFPNKCARNVSRKYTVVYKSPAPML